LITITDSFSVKVRLAELIGGLQIKRGLKGGQGLVPEWEQNKRQPVPFTENRPEGLKNTASNVGAAFGAMDDASGSEAILKENLPRMLCGAAR